MKATRNTQTLFTDRLELKALDFKAELVQDLRASNVGTWRLVREGSLDSKRYVHFDFQTDSSSFKAYESGRNSECWIVLYRINMPSNVGTSLDDAFARVLAWLLGNDAWSRLTKEQAGVQARAFLEDQEEKARA